MALEKTPELPEELVEPLREKLRDDDNLVCLSGVIDDYLAELENAVPGPIDPISEQNSYLARLAFASGMKKVLDTLTGS